MSKQYIIICQQCGKEFETTNKNRKFCSKSCSCTYTHLHMSDEAKLIRSKKISDKNRDYYDNMSDEERELKRQKDIETLRRISKDENIQKKRVESLKKAWENKSEEEKEEFGYNHSLARQRYYETTSPEKIELSKQQWLIKFKDTISNRSLEEQQLLHDKMSIVAKHRWEEMSDEAKNLSIQKRKDTMNNWSDERKLEYRKALSDANNARTPEQLKIRAEKVNETKRKNGTFNSSKPEDNLYIELCNLFGVDDVKRSYDKDERYPFSCDFYITSRDLFIELNFHWSHGGRPFNENDQACLDKLEEWCEAAQTSKYVENAIYTWTIRDVKKRETARKNNINYIELFSVDDVMNFLGGVIYEN